MSANTFSPYGDQISGDELNAAGQFSVHLASVGNPDFGQNPDQSLYGAEPDRWQPVGSLNEASQACRQFIADNELGGGNWAGGDVKDGSGTVVARISYNGRIWRPNPDFAG